MARRGHFVKQAAILGLASLLVRLIGFFYRIPLTEWVGDEGNTYYLNAYFIYAFAITITSASLPAAISKLVSERVVLNRFSDAHQLFKTALVMATVFSAVVVFVLFFGAEWLVGHMFPDLPGVVYALRALAPTIFVVAILAVFRGYFQGLNNMYPTAVSQVVEQIFNATFSLWLARIFYRSAMVEHAAAGAAAGTGIGAVAGAIVVFGFYLTVARLIRVRAAGNHHTLELTGGPESHNTQIKALLSTAFPIIIGMGIYQAANIIDTAMIGNRLMSSGAFTLGQVRAMSGQFTGKFLLLTTLPVSLSVALSQAVIPDISSSNATKNKRGVRSKVNIAMRVSMMISIPAAVGLSVLADPILAMLFPSHPEGGWLLRYGAVSIIFLAMVQVSTGALQGIGKVFLPAFAAFCGVAVKIPLNWVLLGIPAINIMGTVISTIVCYVVAAGINLHFLRKHTGVKLEILGTFVRPSIAASGMGMACFVAHHMVGLAAPGRVATLVAILVGVVVYLFLMWLLGGFPKQDIQRAPIPRFLRRWLNS